MITLDIQKYCHGCPDFEADVKKSTFVCDNDVLAFDTMISCANKNRCYEIKKYLESKEKKNV